MYLFNNKVFDYLKAYFDIFCAYLCAFIKFLKSFYGYKHPKTYYNNKRECRFRICMIIQVMFSLSILIFG